MSESDVTFGSFALLDSLPEEQQAAALKAIINCIPDAVMAHGPDGDLVFWSDGVCDLLGYTRAEIDAMRPFGWVEPSAMRGAPSRLETILHDGNLTFESKAVRKDGTVIPTLVSTRRIDTRVGPLIVAVIRDVTSFKTAQDQLAFISRHDALTGVANREVFEERLRLLAADSRRYGDNLAVVFVDLDHFHEINDRYGYSTGDSILIATAARLQAAVREQDVVARMGSDEFLVLLARGRTDEGWSKVVERLLSAVAGPLELDGVTHSLSATCGLEALGSGPDDLKSLVPRAEMAMRAAKKANRGGWLGWSHGLGVPANPMRG